MSLKLNVREAGHVSIVDLAGKITIGEGDSLLREKVLALLEGGKKNILLNLESVSYMDSAGIGELVACYKRAREKGGNVKLLKPAGKVQDLLALTKLEEVFDSYQTEKDALVAF